MFTSLGQIVYWMGWKKSELLEWSQENMSNTWFLNFLDLKLFLGLVTFNFVMISNLQKSFKMSTKIVHIFFTQFVYTFLY